MKTRNNITINIENLISSILYEASKYESILESNNVFNSSIDGIINSFIFSTDL